MASASVKVLFSMPCAAGGVGNACAGIVAGATAAGYRTTLHAPRMDIKLPRDVLVKPVLPPFLPSFGYGRLQQWVDPILNRRFISSMGLDDVAHVWPAAPLDLYDRLLARGVTIIGEAVNTLMDHAKVILDAEYDAIGLPPRHGITAERIRNQYERYSRCAAVFSPSEGTETAFAGTVFAGRTLVSSYGTWVPKSRPARPMRDADVPVRVLFGGSPNVRKGIHKVLSIWPGLPRNIELRLLGSVEASIAERYADVLNLPNVSHGGFTADLPAEYRNADLALLPSLEEGDPLMTYEACAAGLPMIASPMGAGRIGSDTGCISVLSTGTTDELQDRILTLTSDADQRRALADRAWEAVQDYDWSRVAERRYRQLEVLTKRSFRQGAPKWSPPRATAKAV